MFSGVCSSMPMIDDPSTRMPCCCSVRMSESVSAPESLAYLLSFPSRPIQTHETPSATSCSIL